MTIEKRIKKKLTVKIIAICLFAAVLVIGASFVYETLDIWHKLQTVALSLAILLFFAYKIKLIRMLRDSFWTGTVISVRSIKEFELLGRYRSIILFTEITIEKDAEYKKPRTKRPERPIKIKVKSSKVHPSIFRKGDRVMHFKGADYPLNLTRRKEIHICPVCARNCSQDYCVDCHMDFSNIEKYSSTYDYPFE